VEKESVKYVDKVMQICLEIFVGISFVSSVGQGICKVDLFNILIVHSHPVLKIKLNAH
jgi:hypothetical protein